MEVTNQQIMEAIHSLPEKLATILLSNKPQNNSRSQDLNELFGALSMAQASMQIAGLNKENPYYKSKYSDMVSIINASRPHLTKNNLCVIQQILPNDDGQNILHTLLCHKSGQYIESRMRIVPPKADVQTLHSYILYLRRVSYSSLVGIASQNEDDDAEMAQSTERELFAKGPALNTKYSPREESYETITKEQLDEIYYELSAYPDIAEDVLLSLQIQNLSDMPKSKYPHSIRRIRDIVATRNGLKKTSRE